MSVGIVIQARMSSTRLPGKVLMDVAGKPLLDHILDRMALVKHRLTTVVATSDGPADDPIARHCEDRRQAVFRGSEADVLARYIGCAATFGFDHVVRLTADNPFVDPAEIDRLIDRHVEDGNDYTQSVSSLPVGVGAEIFSQPALAKSGRLGLQPHHREHVNEFILENPQAFRTGALDVGQAKTAPHLRLTVDTQQDYEYVCRIAAQHRDTNPSTEDLIATCMRFA